MSIEFILKFLPKVCHFIENQENDIMSIGRDLTQEELAIAKKIGVKNFDIIKVYESPIVPTPNDTVLSELGKQVSLISSNTKGICFRYGIFINENSTDKKAVLIHELIHTLQYERFGSIEAFISQYLKECFEVGYHQSVLENEAVNGALELYV